MNYLTTQEAADKLGVTNRRVRQLCSGGQVPGAKRIGRDWLIPGSALVALRGRPPRGRPKNSKKKAD